MRVILIDISAVFWPAWHAGDEGNGVEARLRTVTRCRALSEGYDRAVICVDAGDSGRRDRYPRYKADRQEKPAAALEQLGRAVEYLGHDGFHVVRGAGYEADDTIATVCEWAERETAVAAVVIACADKDILQLVGGKVAVHSLSTGDILGAGDVEAKIGVPPHMVADMLALVGDRADNISGVPGIGPKTAAALVQEHGDLEAIIAAARRGAVAGVRGSSLVAHAQQSLDARAIIRLQTDSPITPEIIMQEPPRDPTPEPPRDPPDVIDTTATDPVGDDASTGPLSSVVTHIGWTTQLEPPTMRAAHWLAESVIRSRLFAGYGNPDAALMCIVAGREMGLGAVASLRGFHVIKGRLCMSAQLMVGVVLRSGLAEYMEPVLSECSDESATWATRRVGSSRDQAMTFTMEDARRAGLLAQGGNWERYPGTMLRWRAAADLARACYPDAVGNVYTDADGMDS